MNIHLNNYEAYFLDYHEGTLSIEQVKELMEFLDRHPELAEEFESFEQVTLNTLPEITYEEKETLKKQPEEITASSFDEYAVEYVEGTLPVEKQKELASFIVRNAHFKKELELYGKTKLVPETIVFDDKDSLKRKEGSRRVIWYWSAAASVALLIGAYFIVNRNEAPADNNLVQRTSIKDSNVVANQTKSTGQISDTANPGKNAVPVINRINNNRGVAFKIQHGKQNKNGNSIPASSKDSTVVAAIKQKNNNHTEPVKKPGFAPAYSGKDSTILASNGHHADTSSAKEPLIIVKASQPEPSAKKKGKFLIALARITCKGLRKVTGQHIELEEHYASDTTTVVAYQLDLGNRKFQFPVRE